MRRKSFHLINQEIKCFRCPRIETARALLQDIHDSPNVIVIHTETNDLTASSPMNDFIYDLTTLITQASIKFPHSKVIYSSLLPCADIPIYTINYINQQLIAAYVPSYPMFSWLVTRIYLLMAQMYYMIIDTLKNVTLAFLPQFS